MLVDLFLQPDLDQRLIGHVMRVGGSLDGFQQVQRQAQRNGLGGGLEVGHDPARGSAPRPDCVSCPPAETGAGEENLLRFCCRDAVLLILPGISGDPLEAGDQVEVNHVCISFKVRDAAPPYRAASPAPQG